MNELLRKKKKIRSHIHQILARVIYTHTHTFRCYSLAHTLFRLHWSQFMARKQKHEQFPRRTCRLQFKKLTKAEHKLKERFSLNNIFNHFHLHRNKIKTQWLQLFSSLSNALLLTAAFVFRFYCHSNILMSKISHCLYCFA